MIAPIENGLSSISSTPPVWVPSKKLMFFRAAAAYCWVSSASSCQAA